MTSCQLVYNGFFLDCVEEKLTVYSVTSANIHKSTRHIIADYHGRQYLCENLKSCNPECALSHDSCRQPQTYVKPEAAITVYELLMMSGVSLETC
jgi:hypothetical protein